MDAKSISLKGVNYQVSNENNIVNKTDKLTLDENTKKVNGINSNSTSKKATLLSDQEKIDQYFNRIEEKINEIHELELKELNTLNLKDDDLRRGANIVKAKSIVANLSRGVVVSSLDISFADSILPGEVQKARATGDEFRKQKIEEIRKNNNYIDYKI